MIFFSLSFTDHRFVILGVEFSHFSNHFNFDMNAFDKVKAEDSYGFVYQSLKSGTFFCSLSSMPFRYDLGAIIIYEFVVTSTFSYIRFVIVSL